MEKQKLLSEQGRLADRCTAEMVLLVLSASKGGYPSNLCVYYLLIHFMVLQDVSPQVLPSSSVALFSFWFRKVSCLISAGNVIFHIVWSLSSYFLCGVQ